MTESELIAALRQGSQSAFNEIYRLYAKRLFAFCYQFCKSVEETEEIVEDVFVKLWLHRASIRHDDTVRPLLFVIMRRRLINAYRARVSSPVYSSYQEMAMARRADSSHADYQLEYDDFVRRLHQAVGELPATQRKVFVMAKLEGLRNREIVSALGLSEQTVKNQLFLAVKYLRARLDPFALLYLCLAGMGC